MTDERKRYRRRRWWFGGSVEEGQEGRGTFEVLSSARSRFIVTFQRSFFRHRNIPLESKWDQFARGVRGVVKFIKKKSRSEQEKGKKRRGKEEPNNKSRERKGNEDEKGGIERKVARYACI